MKGMYCLLLHHHLPFIKHPEFDYFMEEHWLFEALIESYIPLLATVEELEGEGVDFKFTVSLTPPLCEMLSDHTLRSKFRKFLHRTLELAEKEVKRTENDTAFHPIARFYLRRLEGLIAYYTDNLREDILARYRELQERGRVEIVTSACTHGLLPALQAVPEAVRTQLKVAVKNYRKHFHTSPKGIWLPECGYYPEVEEELRRLGIEYFFLDAHGVIYGKPCPPYGVYTPIRTPAGSVAFGRDPEASKQVWSAREGYPGDPWYRDFYRDIGFDLPLEYIAPYINPDGSRTYTGFKYYRVTGDVDLGSKEPYVPHMAEAKAKVHADHYHFCRAKQVEHLSSLMDRPPLIFTPFDAELFGHWWFEGPKFLKHLFQNFDRHKVVKPVTPSEYLEAFPENPVSQPSVSSWGNAGYFDVWINGKNDWLYPYLTDMAITMNRLRSGEKRNTRVLNQMLRELLLAQSSDWTFLITTETAKEYATNRLKEHIGNFYRLKEMLSGKVDLEALKKLENKNSIFQELNFWEDWG